MSHPAQIIVDTVQAILASELPSAVSVYVHRRLSIVDNSGDLPAVTVDYGEDTPITEDGAATLDGIIESLQTINVTATVADPDETIVRRELLELRAQVHRAIKRMQDLGLPFVKDTHYGGALPPDVYADGDVFIGELTSQWGVRYEMDQYNPE